MIFLYSFLKKLYLLASRISKVFTISFLVGWLAFLEARFCLVCLEKILIHTHRVMFVLKSHIFKQGNNDMIQTHFCLALKRLFSMSHVNFNEVLLWIVVLNKLDIVII